MVSVGIAASALVVALVVTAGGQSTPTAATAAQVPAASAAPLSPEREQRLRARVTAYYDARRVRDPKAMYDLHEPAYRAKNDYGTYAQQTTIRLRFSLLTFAISAIDPQPDDAVVVRMKLQMDLTRFGETLVEPADRWVWREGDWWIAFREFEPPFPR